MLCSIISPSCFGYLAFFCHLVLLFLYLTCWLKGAVLIGRESNVTASSGQQHLLSRSAPMSPSNRGQDTLKGAGRDFGGRKRRADERCIALRDIDFLQVRRWREVEEMGVEEEEEITVGRWHRQILVWHGWATIPPGGVARSFYPSRKWMNGWRDG